MAPPGQKRTFFKKTGKAFSENICELVLGTLRCQLTQKGVHICDRLGLAAKWSKYVACLQPCI